MIYLQTLEVHGFPSAIKGMRNPKNSWDRSDSVYEQGPGLLSPKFVLGDADLALAKTLAKGGAVHAKYRRMIQVWVDVTAPLYWWKEMDTYRMGKECDSCSTMHKIADKEFEPIDFSFDHVDFDYNGGVVNTIIAALNVARADYINAKDHGEEEWAKHYWWQMIQLLPSSYNQTRTLMLSYETLTNIYTWRKNHKLDEWKKFCEWIEQLPYSELITGKED